MDKKAGACQLRGVLSFCMLCVGFGVASLLPGVAVGCALRFWVGPARAAARAELAESPSGLMLVTASSC
ncbi:MAG TPA: hypothetical protein VGQ57_02695, partial [Polyangiaceae bacterium]|nr:hypothetical protein [Polyangiaceae bacterium]